MTVKELIEELKKHPDTTVVQFAHNEITNDDGMSLAPVYEDVLRFENRILYQYRLADGYVTEPAEIRRNIAPKFATATETCISVVVLRS